MFWHSELCLKAEFSYRGTFLHAVYTPKTLQMQMNTQNFLQKKKKKTEAMCLLAIYSLVSPKVWTYTGSLKPRLALSTSVRWSHLQFPWLLRATMRSPLRSPAQVEGTQGFLPQPRKALERPSSTCLEARFLYCREPAHCILSAYCILHIECSTLHNIIFQHLE